MTGAGIAACYVAGFLIIQALTHLGLRQGVSDRRTGDERFEGLLLGLIAGMLWPVVLPVLLSLFIVLMLGDFVLWLCRKAAGK